MRTLLKFLILVILLAWPSVWFFAKYPILWNYMDGFLQISTKPSAANLLVWPPLYCFGARVPMMIGYLIGGGTFYNAVRYISHPVLTDSAILTLIVIQHLALLCASLVFVHTLSKKALVQILIALVFSSFSFVYATAHTIGSESGSVVLILLVAAISVEIARSGKLDLRRSILVSGILSAAVLTRHINAVMLLLPVAAAVLPHLKDGRSAFEVCRSAASRGLVAVVAGVAALAFSNCLVWVWCLRAKVDHRSMVGLTFLARIDQMRNSPGRFAEFVDEMSTHLRDPVVVATLQRLKSADAAHEGGADFITKAKATIEEVSIEHGLLSNARSLPALMDEKFNALAVATFLAQPRSFRQAVESDWLEGQNWSGGYFTRCLIGGTAIDWENDPLSKKMEPLRGLATFSNFTFADLNALGRNFTGPFLADKILIWHLVLGAGILGLGAAIIRIPVWNIAIALWMLVVGELVYWLSCSIAGQVCRYSIPLLELVVCAALTLLAAILELILDRLGVCRQHPGNARLD